MKCTSRDTRRGTIRNRSDVKNVVRYCLTAAIVHTLLIRISKTVHKMMALVCSLIIGWHQEVLFLFQSFCNQYVLKRHVDSMHRGIKEEHICQDCGKIFTQVSCCCGRTLSFSQKELKSCLVCVRVCVRVCACVCVRAHTNVCVGVRAGDAVRLRVMLLVLSIIFPSADMAVNADCSGPLQKHSLAEHAALHLEQRPHVCDICGASFTYKSSLRSHRRTQHTEPDTRKFVCTVRPSLSITLKDSWP